MPSATEMCVVPGVWAVNREKESAARWAVGVFLMIARVSVCVKYPASRFVVSRMPAHQDGEHDGSPLRR